MRGNPRRTTETNDEHARRHVADHRFGHGSEKDARETGPPHGADHHEARTYFHRDVDDRLRRIAVHDAGRARHAMKSERTREALFDTGAKRRHRRLRNRKPLGRGRHGKVHPVEAREVESMHGNQIVPRAPRLLRRGCNGRERRIRKVGRHQNTTARRLVPRHEDGARRMAGYTFGDASEQEVREPLSTVAPDDEKSGADSIGFFDESGVWNAGKYMHLDVATMDPEEASHANAKLRRDADARRVEVESAGFRQDRRERKNVGDDRANDEVGAGGPRVRRGLQDGRIRQLIRVYSDEYRGLLRAQRASSPPSSSGMTGTMRTLR